MAGHFCMHILENPADRPILVSRFFSTFVVLGALGQISFALLLIWSFFPARWYEPLCALLAGGLIYTLIVSPLVGFLGGIIPILSFLIAVTGLLGLLIQVFI